MTGARSEPESDGRRRRGRRRRAVLIEAALAVVARDGAGAVTHRAVAEQAGLPHSAVSHHFASIDELLADALASGSAGLVAALPGTHRGDDDLAWFAEELVQFFLEHRERVVAGYELYLFAARRPALDGAVAQWLGLLDAVARRHTGDDRRAGLFANAVDGYFLGHLATRTDPEAASLRRLLEVVLATG